MSNRVGPKKSGGLVLVVPLAEVTLEEVIEDEVTVGSTSKALEVSPRNGFVTEFGLLNE